uniref:Uncharacterized protein n=1 Tax=Ciona intestinalis TaxID=7719 RepID=H2XJR5_CIOIN
APYFPPNTDFTPLLGVYTNKEKAILNCKTGMLKHITIIQFNKKSTFWYFLTI